jgi:hypothetical protein
MQDDIRNVTSIVVARRVSGGTFRGANHQIACAHAQGYAALRRPEFSLWLRSSGKSSA